MAEAPDSIDEAVDALGVATSAEIRDDPFVHDYPPRELAAYALAQLSSGGGGGGGGGWPVSAFIVANTPPKAQNNYDNPTASNEADGIGIAPFGALASDNSDGAWIEWNVSLDAGTYALTVKGWPWSGGGILVFSLDDGGGATDIDDAPYSASSALLDTYSAGGSSHALPAAVADDITIPEAGALTLRATVTGKNASSSGFATNLCWLSMQKVAE